MEEPTRTLDENYEINIPEIRNPRIKVSDIDNGVDESNLIENIKN